MSLGKIWTTEFLWVQRQVRHNKTKMKPLSRLQGRSILMIWRLAHSKSQMSKSLTQVYGSLFELVNLERPQCQAMCPWAHHPPTWSRNQSSTKHHRSINKLAHRLNRSLKSSSNKSTPRKNYLIDLLPRLDHLIKRLEQANGWMKQLLDFISKALVMNIST